MVAAAAGAQAAGTDSAGGYTVVTYDMVGAGDFTLTAGELAGRLKATVADSLGGSGGLTFAGPGQLTLAGANTYTGPTAVTAGALVVNGTVSSGVSVAAATLLSGTGRIAGLVIVSAGGTFAPGASPGVITVGSLSFSGVGGTVAMEITGTSKSSPVEYDQIIGTSLGPSGTSSIDYTGGVLNLQMSGTYAVGTVFDLFTFPITTGTLASISMAGSSGDWSPLTWFAPGASGPGTFDYGASVWQSAWITVGGERRKLLFDQSSGDLVVVPEPSTFVMAAVGLVGLAVIRSRRRRSRRQAAARAGEPREILGLPRRRSGPDVDA